MSTLKEVIEARFAAIIKAMPQAPDGSEYLSEFDRGRISIISVVERIIDDFEYGRR